MRERLLSENKRKLLIVEDDPGLQSQLRWCFEDYEVLVAEDRESALAQLRRHEPSVVLQDLGLPPDAEGVSEGLKTLEQTLSLAPDTKVIVVTGHGDQENALRAVGLGAHDFYQKPVETETLQLIVDRAYQMYELELENQRLFSKTVCRHSMALSLQATRCSKSVEWSRRLHPPTRRRCCLVKVVPVKNY